MSSAGVRTNVATCSSYSRIAAGPSGSVYATNSAGSLIYKISSSGSVSVLASSFSWASGMSATSSGDIYVVDSGVSRVLKVTAAEEKTVVAGSADSGAADRSALGATFESPQVIAIDKPNANKLYVGRYYNTNIRIVSL